MLLEELENEIDGWKQDLAASSSAASVHLARWGLGLRVWRVLERSLGNFVCDVVVLCLFSIEQCVIVSLKSCQPCAKPGTLAGIYFPESGVRLPRPICSQFNKQGQTLIQILLNLAFYSLFFKYRIE